MKRSIALLLCSMLSWAIAQAQLSLDLGEDTLACGVVVLDAGNPGATYAWSTGEITQMITVSSSDTVWVEVASAGDTARDTIVVLIIQEPSMPQVSDTFQCGNGLLTLVAGGAMDTSSQILWYRKETFPQVLSRIDSLSYAPTSDDTLLVRRIRTTDSAYVGGITAPAGNFFTSGNRGLRFDVLAPHLWESVDLTANNDFLIRIAVLDQAQDTVFQQAVEVIAGLNTIPMYLELPVGTDYTLIAYDFPSGANRLRWTNSTAYPYDISDKVRISGAESGATNRYNFFFSWVIRDLACYSPIDTAIISFLPSPVVDFPSDTALCADSLVLDASFPGATYVWNTGATSATITVVSDSIYSVVASLGICSVTDSVSVSLLSTPDPPSPQDTSLCGPQVFPLSLPDTATSTYWYNQATGGIPVAQGETFSPSVASTDTFWSAYVEYAPILIGGYLTPPGGNLFINQSLGAEFDVIRDCYLKQVTMWADNPTSCTVQLLDDTLGIIYEAVVNLQGGEEDVALDWPLSDGEGYRLIATDITGGRLRWTNQNANYPYEIPGYIRINRSSNGFTNRFYYFYNWELSRLGCRSPRVENPVTILPVPTLELGNDTLVCSPTLTLDVENPNATYLWSTGDTISSLLVDTTGTYGVTVTIGPCSDSAAVSVEFGNTPDPIVPVDTTICSPTEITLMPSFTADELGWFETDTGNIPFFNGGSIKLPIQDTTTLYIQSLNSGMSFGGGAPSTLVNALFLQSNFGLRFDVNAPTLLKSLVIPISGPCTADLQLFAPSGDLIESLPLSLTAVTPLTLNWQLEPGMGYTLRLANIDGGSVGWINSSITYPYNIDDRIRITGTHTGNTNAYYFFFNWEIARGGCVSNRVPVQVDVTLPIRLPDSVYTCDTTTLNAFLPAADSYLWSSGETTAEIFIDEPALYTVQVDDGQGCIARDTTLVEIPQGVGLPDNGILCGNILSTVYGDDAIFLWSTGDSTSSIQIDTIGTYSVVVSEPRGCVIFDTVAIQIIDSFPLVDLGPDLVACDSAILIGTNEALTYVWSTGDEGDSLIVKASGTYSAIGTNVNGCSTADTLSVFVSGTPEADFFVPDTVFSPTLSVNFINLSSFGSVLWDFGDGATSNQVNPVHTYADPGTYCVTLVVSDALNDCGSDTAELCVVVDFTSSIISQTVGTETPWEVERIAPDQLAITLTHLQPAELSLRLIDLTGRSVRQARLTLVPGQVKYMDLSHLPAGIYWVYVSSGTTQTVHKQLVRP